MTNKDRKNKVIQRQGNRRQKDIMDKVFKDRVTGEKDRMTKNKTWDIILVEWC